MDKILFYDTNYLLSNQKAAFEQENFYISSITLRELENIKTSSYKDEDIKYRAREVVRMLEKNEGKYNIVIFQENFLNDIKQYDLPITPDVQIISCALALQNDNKQVIFVTEDLLCKKLAQVVGLDVQYKAEEKLEYRGFTEITANTEEELADIYTNIIFAKDNVLNVLENEYLIIRNVRGEVVDKYKYKDGEYQQIQYQKVESRMFGRVSPKEGDIYQQLALDALQSNQLTVLRGPAGSGKSYLAFAYMFSLLEKGKIDKIIVFCNTVATRGAAKLGLTIG